MRAAPILPRARPPPVRVVSLAKCNCNLCPSTCCFEHLRTIALSLDVEQPVLDVKQPVRAPLLVDESVSAVVWREIR